MSSKKGSVGVVGVCIVIPVKTVLVEESCVVDTRMSLVVAEVCGVLAAVVIVITVETLDVNLKSVVVLIVGDVGVKEAAIVSISVLVVVCIEVDVMDVFGN